MIERHLQSLWSVLHTMKLLTPEQTATLKPWFLPEQPGPLIGSHIIHTGNGACFGDRWPAPRTILAETSGNYTLLGDPEAVTPAEIQHHIKGFVETSEAFLPLLQAHFPIRASGNASCFASPICLTRQPPAMVMASCVA
ncbi:MAG: hypothetical protein HC837_18655 [Chloroflexaceae bacterium]|nr:hypothetical protein [Chloroflexaceae bacterium]